VVGLLDGRASNRTMSATQGPAQALTTAVQTGQPGHPWLGIVDKTPAQQITPQQQASDLVSQADPVMTAAVPLPARASRKRGTGLCKACAGAGGYLGRQKGADGREGLGS
jgi:hypothetical protein